MAPKMPFLVVFLIQIIYAGMFLLSKAAFNVGMNNFIFTFYRQAVATIFLAPFAVFIEWKAAPPLPLKTFCKIFVMSLLGITLSLDLYGVGLMYSSASLGAATANCVPVITFFLAVLVRLEAWNIKTPSGIAKLIGILICLGGAMTLALYKGPSVKVFSYHQLINRRTGNVQAESQALSRVKWIKGCFILLTGNSFWALWIVMQAKIMKEYPSKLLLTMLSCFLSSIQSFAVAIVVERRQSEWMLGWNISLVAVAYCGIVVTGVAYYLQAYVIDKKGPVFLAMWTPLGLVITMICSAFLLGESITLGSILGGILLIGGLYSFLWAKSREHKIISPSCSLVEDAGKECGEFKSMEELEKSTSNV